LKREKKRGHEFGDEFRTNSARKKMKHTISNKLRKNLQGMNQGMNVENKHAKNGEKP
jgi:hypothetical protein